MKIRLTESQLKALEEVIAADEAFDGIIKDDFRLVAYLDKYSITFIVRHVDGNGITMHTTKKFPIDLRGIMVGFSRDSFGKSNKMELVKTHRRTGDGDNWEVIESPKPYTINGVNKIDILDTTGKRVETIVTDEEWINRDEKDKAKAEKKDAKKAGYDKYKKDQESQSPEEIKVDMDKVIQQMKNDPILKKVISHQPKLFGMFNDGNPVGVAHMKDLVGDYDKFNDKAEKLGASGKRLLDKKDEVIIVRFDQDVELEEGGHTLSLSSSSSYKTKVEGQSKLKSVPFKKEFNFKILLKDEVGNNKFTANVVTEYIEKSGAYNKITKEVTVTVEY